ncbi:MAG TPA: hypothetical protein VMT55_02805, partial [Candidatus Sulfotelmatobacter sp.]|nr:hypothetical protein [Candidatus Sulfotelmatobacter sp.]
MKMFGKLFVILCLLFVTFSPVRAETYESLSIINGKNWADYLGNHLGFLYDSHGCLHFTPSDIYLLVKTVPKGAKLTIKGYRDKQLPEGYSKAPLFRTLVNDRRDVQKYAETFAAGQAGLVVYPGLGYLYILAGDQPLVKVKTLPGPEHDYRQVLSADPDGEIT